MSIAKHHVREITTNHHRTMNTPKDDETLSMPNWEEDCMHFRGRVLTGKHAHWCTELDGLPVDETCPEWGNCTCFDDVEDDPDAPDVSVHCRGFSELPKETQDAIIKMCHAAKKDMESGAFDPQNEPRTCPYCDQPRQDTFENRWRFECGTSLQQSDGKTVKQGRECKLRVAYSTEPSPAPAQTAREWLKKQIADPSASIAECLNTLADRADRAEAECRDQWLASEINLRAIDALRAERDTLRAALERIIVAFKGEPCVAPNHPEDGYKCKFSAHPIGRKWGGYCDNHNIDLIARAALNPTNQ